MALFPQSVVVSKLIEWLDGWLVGWLDGWLVGYFYVNILAIKAI